MKLKNSTGRPIHCEQCGDKIEPGEQHECAVDVLRRENERLTEQLKALPVVGTLNSVGEPGSGTFTFSPAPIDGKDMNHGDGPITDEGLDHCPDCGASPACCRCDEMGVRAKRLYDARCIEAARMREALEKLSKEENYKRDGCFKAYWEVLEFAKKKLSATSGEWLERRDAEVKADAQMLGRNTLDVLRAELAAETTRREGLERRVNELIPQVAVRCNHCGSPMTRGTSCRNCARRSEKQIANLNILLRNALARAEKAEAERDGLAAALDALQEWRDDRAAFIDEWLGQTASKTFARLPDASQARIEAEKNVMVILHETFGGKPDPATVLATRDARFRAEGRKAGLLEALGRVEELLSAKWTDQLWGDGIMTELRRMAEGGGNA